MFSDVSVFLSCPVCDEGSRVVMSEDEYRSFFVMNNSAERAFSSRSERFQKFVSTGAHYDCQENLSEES